MRVNALGPFLVKGLAEPVDVFELVGATPRPPPLAGRCARGLTRFVGRGAGAGGADAGPGAGRGRAGPGGGAWSARPGWASRAWCTSSSTPTSQGWRVLESASVSYGKATPYFPVIDLLKRYAHVEDTDDARTIRAKVTGQVLTLDETLQDRSRPCWHCWMPCRRTARFCSSIRRSAASARSTALKRVLLRESQVQPLLLVFEDLHWIDAETQALLDSLVESLPTARLLLLVNYRPEYQHGWGSKTYYTQLRLDPLPPASAEASCRPCWGTTPAWHRSSSS